MRWESVIPVHRTVRPDGTDYAGSTAESVNSLSIVWLITFSTVAPTFDLSRSMIQHCWPCSNGPRAITLINTPSSLAGSSSTSVQIASVSPKLVSRVSLSSTCGFCIVGEMHRFPLQIIAARTLSERVRAGRGMNKADYCLAVSNSTLRWCRIGDPDYGGQLSDY